MIGPSSRSSVTQLGRRTDEFYPAFLCPPIRRHADEGGQKRMMNVDQRTPRDGKELRREDLHVPGQHHQIHVSAQHVELAPRWPDPNILGRRHVQE